jgi:hypothetical protein
MNHSLKVRIMMQPLSATHLRSCPKATASGLHHAFLSLLMFILAVALLPPGTKAEIQAAADSGDSCAFLDACVGDLVRLGVSEAKFYVQAVPTKHTSSVAIHVARLPLQRASDRSVASTDYSQHDFWLVGWAAGPDHQLSDPVLPLEAALVLRC